MHLHIHPLVSTRIRGCSFHFNAQKTLKLQFALVFRGGLVWEKSAKRGVFSPLISTSNSLCTRNTSVGGLLP